MDTRISKIRKLIALALTAAVLLFTAMALATMPSLAVGNDAENDEDKPEITIEVVEEIPAEDIEEQPVPLAASADTKTAEGVRHTVVIWTLAALIIAYSAFLLSGMRLRKSNRQIKAGTEGDRNDGAGGGNR